MQGPLFVPRIIWAALFVSALIYIVVLELVTVEASVASEAPSYLFAFAAAMSAAGSLVAPRVLSNRQRTNAGEKNAAYVTALILSLALAESVAIFGLVVGFLGAPASVVVPFFAAAWILMLIQFPTQEKLDRFGA